MSQKSRLSVIRMVDRTVPLSLAINQIRAYQYAFVESVTRANRAIKQRDCYRDIAIESKCAAMQATDACPEDVEDPCPVFFGGYCKACLKAVDTKARYL